VCSRPRSTHEVRSSETGSLTLTRSLVVTGREAAHLLRAGPPQEEQDSPPRRGDGFDRQPYRRARTADAPRRVPWLDPCHDRASPPDHHRCVQTTPRPLALSSSVAANPPPFPALLHRLRYSHRPGRGPPARARKPLDAPAGPDVGFPRPLRGDRPGRV
jgi:hypothetical protein